MFNAFRYLADSIHLLAFVLLLVKLWRTKSSAAISGKTQILYAIVFTLRYMDLLSPNHYHSYYVSSAKIAFIVLSYLNVYLIYGAYKKTYDRENDVVYNEFLIIPCFVLSLYYSAQHTPLEIMWTFSIFLEAVAIVPQLDLMCRIVSIDNYTVSYLVALGLYRMLYILNWAYRYTYEGFYDPVALYSGFLMSVLFVFVFLRICMIKRHERGTMIKIIA